MRPTVLIVDDHAAFRASARALLQAEGFEVVGEAADGAEAVEAVAALRPAIVLLDIQLPDLDGLAVAQQLARVPDGPAVVLISSRDAATYGPRLQATPARGSSPRAGCLGRRSPPWSAEAAMRQRGLLGPAAVAVGLAAEWVGVGWGDPRHWIPDLAVGWTFVGCGLIAAWRRPESRSGLLMAATGFTWFVGNFAQVGVTAIAWVAAHEVEELAVSRRRILQARDEERRRLERRLHDGAEARLRELAVTLRRGRSCAAGEQTREQLARSQEQLTRTLEDLRRLARGLHPHACCPSRGWRPRWRPWRGSVLFR